MRFVVVTLFPEMLAALTAGGVAARAIERGLASVECVNPRDHARDRHRSVDDRPYGGGPGMVLTAEPTSAALAEARERAGAGAPTVYLSPQGERLDQAAVARLAERPSMVLLCGRYEGVDERVLARDVDLEISIGDFVVSGGELPAMVLMDALIRLRPGALGHEDSAAEDSFSTGLLDCPHFSRPERFRGERVPAVLPSGHHGEVRRWRLKESLGRTWRRRPDLLAALEWDEERRALLEEYIAERSGGDATE